MFPTSSRPESKSRESSPYRPMIPPPRRHKTNLKGVPPQSRTKVLTPSRSLSPRRFNLMNDHDDLPILEDDEDDNEETNNGPILPVFSNVHNDAFENEISNPERGRIKHHHTPIEQLLDTYL
ncbi:unnamed protein product [Ambrosiozyma monospora]|uniref:Unnamed protein product n=1 Tax=Ambrosiozyma monospora TaxID=43982 RepID=A0A9W6YXX3_AMBMO|nr:unnamed protein product [Ambrosiozyma monospora]